MGSEIDEPLALRAVAKLAVNEDVKEEMASASVMSVMVLLLGSGSMPEREAAAGALSNMATNERLRSAVWLSGAGHALVSLLSDPGTAVPPRGSKELLTAVVNSDSTLPSYFIPRHYPFADNTSHPSKVKFSIPVASSEPVLASLLLQCAARR